MRGRQWDATPVPVGEVARDVVVDLHRQELRRLAAECRTVAEYVDGHPAAPRLLVVAERLEARAGGTP